jgi:hypothetical protein
MGDAESVCGSVAIQQDHVPTVGGRQIQCVVLQLFRKITYTLWAGDGRDEVSVGFCSYPARSRTGYGQAMGNAESVHGSVAIQQDHLPAVGGRWAIHIQCVALQLSSKITYSLWVGDRRDGVSMWFCSYLVRSRTLCERAMGETVSVCGSEAIQQAHIQAIGGRCAIQSQCVVLPLSSRITYFLWTGDE